MKRFCSIGLFIFYSIVANCQLAALPIDTTVCESSSVSFYIHPDTNFQSLQWQIRIGSSWQNIQNDSVFFGIDSNVLFLSNVPLLYNGYYFRCEIDTGGLDKQYSDSARVMVHQQTFTGYLNSFSTEYCFGSSSDTIWLTNRIGDIVKWEKNPDMVSWVPLSISDSFYVDSNLLVGNQSYRVIVRNGVCPADTSNILIVKVDTLSIGGDLITSDTLFCQYSKTDTIRVSGAIGDILTWEKRINGGNWASINSNTLFHTDSLIQSGNYNFRAQIKNGKCPSVYTPIVSLYSDSLSVGGSITGTNNICFGVNNNVLILNNANGSIIKWQFRYNNSSWIDTNVLTSSIIPVFHDTGSYSFRTVVKNGVCESKSSDIFNVKVDPISNGGYVSGSNTICQGDFTGLLELNLSKGDIIKWQKQFNTGSWTDIGNYSFYFSDTLALSGTYRYRSIVKSGVCPSDTSLPAIINVDSISVSGIISGISNICLGQQVNLSNQNYNGDILNWQKRLNQGPWIGLSFQQPTYSDIIMTAGSWDYQTQIKNGVCPAVYSNMHSVNVSQPPVAGIVTLLSSDTLCEYDIAKLVLTGYVGDTLKWQISPSGINSWQMLNLSSPYIEQCLPAGDYRFRCVISNSACAEVVSNSVLIHFRNRPIAIISPDTTICSGDSIQLICSGGVSYIWYPNNNISSVFSAMPYVYPTSATNYSAVVTDQFGCRDTAAVSIGVVNRPYLVLNKNVSICQGDSAILSVSGGQSYRWKPFIGLNNDTISNPFAYPSSSTTYSVVGTNSFGCQSVDSVLVSVKPLPNTQVFSNGTTICTGDSLLLTGVGGQMFYWEPDTSVSFNHLPFTYVKPLASTVFTLTSITLEGCSQSNSIMVYVNPLPLIFAGNDTSLCFGDTILLNATGGQSYSWYPNTGLSSSVVYNPLCYPGSSLFYSVSAVDSNGCSNKDSLFIQVFPNPSLTLTNNLVACAGDTIQLNAYGGDFISWSPSLGLNSSQIHNPKAVLNSSTTYHVIVSDTNNCSASDSLNIEIHLLPKSIIHGDTLVCKNQHYSVYKAIPGNNNFQWYVNGGELMNSSYSDQAVVHWFQSDTGSIGFTEQMWTFPYCKSSTFLPVNITKGLAPDPAKVVSKLNNLSNGVLICSFCNYSLMKWGYESKQSGNEIIVNSGVNWCQYSFIDTFNYLYFVYVGDNPDCLTKSYFNEPLFPTSVEGNSGVFWKVFPNPTKGLFHIEAWTEGKYDLQIEIIDLSGRIITSYFENCIYNHYSKSVDLSALSDGVYYVRIKTDRSASVSRLIKLSY